MTRLAFTPGEGGGKPAKPKPAPLPPSYMDAVEDYEIQQEQRLGISNPPQDPPQLPSAKPPGSNPILLKEKAKEQVERARQEREAARNKQQAPDQNIEKPATSVLQDIEWQDDTKYYDLTGFLQLASNSALAAPTSYESTPLTQGQEMHIDHLLAVETDTLAREVLIGLKREGMPSDAYISDFMSQYAEWGWDDLSSALAMQVLEIVRNSDWDEQLAHTDLPPAEAEKQQPYIPTMGVKVSGTLRAYIDETFDPNVDAPVYIFSSDLTSAPLPLIRFAGFNNFGALVQIGDLKYWIDITDEDAQFTFVALGEHGDTPEQEAEGVVADGNQSSDEILPIIPDENAHGGSLDIVGEIPLWDELEEFVNTDLAELQRRAVENPEIIGENVALLEDIFGYDVEFRNREFYIGDGKNEEKSSAIRQIFNIASSHYHVTNTFGIEIMRTTTADTIYHLGADDMTKTKYHGLVPLGQGSTEVFIGSEMAIGGITHETFHEIDRRFGGRLSVLNNKEPWWGLEWYLKNRVRNLESDAELGFNFGMMIQPGFHPIHLNEDSRASDEPWNQEIFPDVAAAVVFGRHEEDFFSKADVYNPDNRIGFAHYGPYVKSIICGIHQYFEHIASGATEPDELTYDQSACQQFWSEQ